METEKIYTLRISRSLYAEIKDMADADERSVNAQIIRILRAAVGARQLMCARNHEEQDDLLVVHSEAESRLE